MKWVGMMNIRRRRFTQGLAVGAVAGLTDLAGLAARAQAAPKRGGTLSMVIPPEPPVLVTLAHDPTVGVQGLYWSKNFKPGVPVSNGSGYSNPEVDRLLEEAAVEIDPVRRRELFRQFQVIIATDLPDVNLVTGTNVTIANRKVVDHATTFDGPSANFADVWLNS
jgi:ABC-type transport system substrate-binding protein